MANLIRWQLIRTSRSARVDTFEQYDAWLNTELARLDAALPLCEKYGLMVALDLHSPPGGKATEGGGHRQGEQGGPGRSLHRHARKMETPPVSSRIVQSALKSGRCGTGPGKERRPCPPRRIALQGAQTVVAAT